MQNSFYLYLFTFWQPREMYFYRQSWEMESQARGLRS